MWRRIMPVHAAPIRVFLLMAGMLAVIAICFGVARITRRRTIARLTRMRAVREAMTPVRYAPTESFPIRRFLWRGLVGLAAGVVLFLGLSRARVVSVSMEPA